MMLLNHIVRLDYINYDVTLSDFFIITSWKWWFLTTYILIYLIHPLVNKFIVEQPIVCFVTILIVGITGFITDVFGWHLFGFISVDNIFNCITCLFCYVIGASLHYIKVEKYSKTFCVFGVLGFSLLHSILGIVRFGTVSLTDATGLCIIFTSLFLVLLGLIADKEKSKKSSFVVSTDIIFCVYLLHEEPFSRNILWGKKNVFCTWSCERFQPVGSICYVALVFVFCAIIGFVLEQSFKYIESHLHFHFPKVTIIK